MKKKQKVILIFLTKFFYVCGFINASLQAETTSVLEEMKRLENNHSFELQLVRKKAEEEKQ